MKMRDPTSMWDEALELLERADRLHRQFFQLEQRCSSQCPIWEPPVDMLETESEVVIVVALPGVAAEQLSVAIDDTAVVVQGQRAMPATGKEATIRRLEIPYGRFERRIEWPSQRLQIRQRLLKDGCLVLTLNKLG